MDVLVSAAAFDRFGEHLAAAAPGARFLLAAEDGVRDRDGKAVLDGEPTVVWFSSDLFAGGRGVAWFRSAFIDSPRLAWVHSSTAGLDSPLFTQLLARGVRVSSAHIYAVPLAEYVLRAALDHFQRADQWRAAEADRAWRPHECAEMAGSTWLVVGLGNIGRRITQVATALGANVLGADRIEPSDASIREFVAADELLGHLSRCDVVVLARPAAPDEPPLVDTRFLAAMRPGSLLVNVARGSLVDESALVAAIDRGTPGRAVLDVMAHEPLPDDSPLWAHPAITITPHSAGQGLGRYRRGAEVFEQNLRAFLAGRPIHGEAAAPAGTS
jgi:phosphoglycerate dehydrogenase-like enzyme